MIWKTKPTVKVRGIARRFAIAGVKSFLILFVAGLWCVQSRGVTGVTNGFETPPPKAGSIQWQNLQHLNKEREELYRKRVPVPGAMSTNVPRAGGGNFATPLKSISTPTPAPVASGSFLKFLFFTAVFVFAGVLAIRKFAPHVLADFNQRFNPLALAPDTEKALPEKVRAEEEAFANFLATFHVGPAASPRDDSLEKGDPVKEFYTRAAKLLGVQQTLLQDIGRESDNSARRKKLTNLCSEMSSLKGEAVFPNVLPVWQMASALEGLLKQLAEKMRNVTASTLRAVAGGVNLLDELCVPGLKLESLTDRPFKFLIVDDDLISRQALSLALNKAFSQPDLAVDGETALAQASQQSYDVIFLDVQMPGMDGFELCEKIHDIPINRTTPIVFVTGQNDFDARAKSTLSGGSDLMAKPFLTFEVTVKALTLALQGRLQSVQKSFPKLDRKKAKMDSPETFKEVTRSATSSPDVVRPLLPTPMIKTNHFNDAFLARASKNLGPLRDLCQKILQTADEATRQNMLADGFLRVNSFFSGNDSETAHPAYQMSVALEGLLKKMLQDPKYSTPSTLATVADAVNLIDELCMPGLKADLASDPPVQMLVVDDDLLTRRVIVGALQTIFTRPESAENGEAALALAKEKPFDVIFMDVVMPGMNGFEVCSKIRDTVPNRVTPVVFVTGQSDFQTRTQMSRNGGTDLMAKPFLTSEITVKALTFALRGRLEQMQPAL